MRLSGSGGERGAVLARLADASHSPAAEWLRIWRSTVHYLMLFAHQCFCLRLAG